MHPSLPYGYAERFRPAVFALTSAAFLVLATPILAWQPPPAGTRVRLTLIGPPPTTRLIGVLETADSTTISILPDKAAVIVSTRRERVQAVDVSVERPSHELTGLGIGLVIGALAGGALGLALGDDPPEPFFNFTAGEKAALAAIGLGCVGGVVGYLAGGLVHSDKWQPYVGETPKVQGIVQPAEHRVAVGVALRL